MFDYKFNLLKPKIGDVIKLNSDTYMCFRGILWTKLDETELKRLLEQDDKKEEK